ncbi:branched-chain amino acid ABC transporter permease [Streptomyces alkaliphilus]|uniref:Branched-chain amino acid ABC transporter permease n=1 Tax=Streptomyces alkaliphilus TaxID=1472722 RepID=A0A7W3TC06_9ACTN|nr:branched-chain amino acid ABC transporter permease [Streptomyces alkaliphilus]MBB0244066.1 branched-chain amino acid ABC transporter permease [Streptomyces alkaliphilus]MQS07291.1 branched-chain amino acid ABC transporter permease [Streptomyces alkaliphilus]
MTATDNTPTTGAAGPIGSKRAAEAARLRRTAWYANPRFKRLAALMGVALVGAQVTGEQGTNRDIFHAMRENMTGPGLWLWVGACLLIWVVREFLRAPVANAWSTARRAGTGPAERARTVWRRDPRLRMLALTALLVFLIVLPFLVSRHWQQVLVDQIAIYVLLAIGLNVVVGWAGMLDLGFIAFFAIGAYSAAFWTGSLPVAPPFELNNFAVIPIAVITCLVAGVLLGAPTLRLRGDYLAIVTLGFHEIVYLMAKNWVEFTGGTRGASVDRFSIDLGFFSYQWGLDPRPYYWLQLGFIVALLVLFIRLEHSRVGRAWTAIREDEVAAAATGVDTVRFKLLAFAIGASTSGVAGVVYASKLGFINSEFFIVLFSVLVLSYVIFGGMGSIPGVLLGTAILIWLPEFLRDTVPAQDRYMYLGALLVIMMIYRPQGLWPSRRRVRELHMAEEGTATRAMPAAGGRPATTGGDTPS